MVAAGIGVVLVTRGPGAVDGEAASDSLEEIVEDPDFEEGDVGLSDCPLGDLADIEDAVGDEVDLSVLEDEEAFGFGAGEGTEEGVGCSSSSDDGGALLSVFGTSVPPGSYLGSLDDLYPDGEVTAEDPRDFRGGDLVAYCVEQVAESDPEVADVEGCGVDWVAADDDLIIGLWAQNLGGDVDELVPVFEDLLPDMVDALAEADPEFEE